MVGWHSVSCRLQQLRVWATRPSSSMSITHDRPSRQTSRDLTHGYTMPMKQDSREIHRQDSREVHGMPGKQDSREIHEYRPVASRQSSYELRAPPSRQNSRDSRAPPSRQGSRDVPPSGGVIHLMPTPVMSRQGSREHSPSGISRQGSRDPSPEPPTRRTLRIVHRQLSVSQVS